MRHARFSRAVTQGVLASLFACLAASPALCEIAVIVNDGKQPLLYEPPNLSAKRPDTVSVIDLGVYPPKILGVVEVPASMIGPPTSIALARDGSFAVVSSAQTFDPADSTKWAPDDKVSLIDLRSPNHPVLVHTLAGGAGATGVSINHAGTLALVANVNAGTVSVFSIARMRLALVDTVPLGPPAGAGDVTISPDGKVALVTQRRGTKVWRLAIEGNKVRDTGIAIETGETPYGIVYGRDGRYAFNTNLGGRIRQPGTANTGPRQGTVTAIDLKTNTVVDTVEVGFTPEHVALSPDGRYLEVTVVNGSSARPSAPGYNEYGFVQIYRVNGGKMTKVTEARTGGWGQGATFSKDNRLLLVQSAINKNIEVYHFDGARLTRDPSASLTFETRPSTIVTALSR